MRRKALKQKKIWNPALFGIRNLLSWNPESSTRNPESTGWPEPGISFRLDIPSGKQENLFRCSVAPGNFSDGTIQKV